MHTSAPPGRLSHGYRRIYANCDASACEQARVRRITPRYALLLAIVRITGLEPARDSPLEPKSARVVLPIVLRSLQTPDFSGFIGISCSSVLLNLFVQNGKDSVTLITNDVVNKERKDDESMGALVALGVFTAIAIVAVIVVVAAVAAIVAGVTDSTKEEEV